MTPAQTFAANFRRLPAERNLPGQPDQIAALLTKRDGRINLSDGAIGC